MSLIRRNSSIYRTVIDVNDNAPKFEQSIYSGSLSQDAVRGQFVTVITASDPDTVDHDHLIYSIVGGNQLQNFVLNSSTGEFFMITCSELDSRVSHNA